MKSSFLLPRMLRFLLLLGAGLSFVSSSARAATAVKPTIYAFNVFGTTTINLGETATLNWSVGDATTISISPGVGVVAGTQVDVTPTVTTTYTLTASNSAGSVTKTRKITVVVPPVLQSFAASPGTVVSGGASTLSWSAPGATSFTVTSDVGDAPGTQFGNTAVVKPWVTTTYTIVARNSAGTDTRSLTVAAVPAGPKPSIALFTATPASVVTGNSTTLSWSVSGATSLSISPGVGAIPAGVTSVTVAPTTGTTYTLTATNLNGSVTKKVIVTVTPPPPPVIASFTASPSSIALGSSSQLSWSVNGATSLSISADRGTSPGPVTGNTLSVSPTGTTLYTLTASGAGGTITQSIQVAVTTPVPLPVIASFTASPATISSGSSMLSWSVSGATSLAIQASAGSNPGNVTGTSFAVSPLTTTVYTLTATNATGSVSQALTVTVVAPTPGIAIESLTATPNNVNAGDAVTLHWVVTGTDSLWMSADNGGDPGSMNGRTSVVVHPLVTTRYVLTAYSSQYGTVSKPVNVTVGPPPLPLVSAFAAAPATIAIGSSTTLSWGVTDAASVSIAADVGASPGVVTGSSLVVSPTVSTTYTLTATNAFGSKTRTTAVVVTGPAAPTIASFTATPAFIQAGGSSVLTWAVSGADSCAIAADVGVSPGAVSGTSVTVSPTATTLYTLTATNNIGSSTATVAVTLYTPGSGNVTHPRIWITPASVSALRQRAAATDPAWVRLRNTCDAFASMPVAWPDENPSSGTINGGYQYMDYLEPATALGLGYQVAKIVDPVRAALYAAKEKQLLLALSDPIHHGRPTTDSGYSIRAYVPALALGYDWIHETLNDSERAQIFTEINRWVASFDQVGFGRNFPNGNYFAGYYCAKALGAIATEGENPNAAAMWNDWLNRIHLQMVQPYYAAWLSGGGAPDGWNYGPFETINLLRPIAAAFTAKGLDLIHHTQPFTYPDGHARWMAHFTWPDLSTVNDRGLLYEGNNPSPATATWATQYSGLLRLANGDNAPVIQQFALELRAKNANDRPESWAEFLFHNPTAPTADYRTRLSLRTPGDGQVAMRSSWATDAVWGAFQAGPYTGYQDSAEEYYDKGSLVIQRGGVQFLVNATGALLRHTPGTEDGGTNQLWNRIYDEIFETQTDGVYHGRRLFNTYYAVRAGGYWGQVNPNPGETTTTLSRCEDRGSYVLMRGANLEDMYIGNHPITGWTRTVAYVRPQLFVAYDRTSIDNAGTDNWMAWHVAANPVEQSGAAPGTHRFDVVDPRPAFGGNLFRGRVTTVFPPGHSVTTVDTFGRGKVYRLEVRPGSVAGAATWLTVFDAAASAASAGSAAPLSAVANGMLAEAMEGTLVTTAGGANIAVLFSKTGSALPGTISFAVPATAIFALLADLVPNTGYAVTASAVNGSLTLNLVPGGAFVTSAEGSLAFNVSATGVVKAP